MSSRMFTKSLSELKEPKVSELGGKGYSLVVLINNGFNIPKGFIITSQAFFEFLKHNNSLEQIEKMSSEINKDNFRERSKEIKDLILKGEIPEKIAVEIKNKLVEMNVKAVAIRSSAVSEDSLRASFAGLFDTFLNMKSEPNLVLKNVKSCWASLFNERAVIYRIRKKLPHLEGIAVVVQEMIPAEVAGTVFTAHPDTGDKSVMIIEATLGLGETLVSGSVTPDLYVVDKRSLKFIKKTIGRKKIMTMPSEDGTKRVRVPNEKMYTFCLNDDIVRNLAEIGLKIEKIFKYPQDIEWCSYKDKIYILQSRSITSLG